MTVPKLYLRHTKPRLGSSIDKASRPVGTFITKIVDRVYHIRNSAISHDLQCQSVSIFSDFPEPHIREILIRNTCSRNLEKSSSRGTQRSIVQAGIADSYPIQRGIFICALLRAREVVGLGFQFFSRIDRQCAIWISCLEYRFRFGRPIKERCEMTAGQGRSLRLPFGWRNLHRQAQVPADKGCLQGEARLEKLWMFFTWELIRLHWMGQQQSMRVSLGVCIASIYVKSFD